MTLTDSKTGNQRRIPVKTRPSALILPVTHWQKYVLDESAHPDCTDDLRDRLVLSRAVLMRPEINMRRLWRAVEKLQHRHDSLRIRFEQEKGTWRAVIDPPGGDVITEIDIGEEDDLSFQAHISALANAPMTLVGPSLFEVVVVRCGRRGDVLILRVHHAITDGHGMVVLIEDLAKLLMGLPILGKAVSHADYISRFQSPARDRAQEVAAFWEMLHADMPQAPNIGRKAKDGRPLLHGFGTVVQKRLTVTATPASVQDFEARSAREGNTPVTALFAAYLEAMCRCYDLDRLMFMTSVSRTDPALDSYIGDHTLDPLLPYMAAGRSGFASAVKELGHTIFRARAHLPSDAARRGGAYEAALIDRGAYPRQFVLEQPSVSVRQNKSLFRKSFGSREGVDLRVGPYQLMILDVSVRRRKWADMHFDVGAADVRKGFCVHFDGISYSDAEINRVGVKICELLALEPTRASIS